MVVESKVEVIPENEVAVPIDNVVEVCVKILALHDKEYLNHTPGRK